MKSQAFHGEVWINAHEAVMEAMIRANTDLTDGGYGNDGYSRRATKLMQAELQAPIYTTFAINGTAANVMALKAMLDRCDALICAEQTHIHTYEAGAFEYNLGNKILTAKTTDGKLTPQIVRDLLTATAKYKYRPRVIALAQPTEFGTLYTAEEIKRLCEFAHDHGMYVYIDGARIGCAVAALQTTLYEMLETTDVDAFSFGGTKAGAMFGEMIVFRRAEFANALAYSQKQSLQHLSKSKFLGAQICAVLEHKLWLTNGERSNRAARLLERCLSEKGYRIYYKVETNMVFCVIPPEKMRVLCEHYDMHYWDEFQHVVRLATTHQTTEADIDTLLSYL